MLYPILPWIFNGVALLIIGASMVLLLRQRGSYFKPIRLFLVSAYWFFSLTLVLEYVRDISPSETTGFWYGYIGVSAIILANLALTVSAIAISNDPSIHLSHFGFRINGKLNVKLLLYTTYGVFLLVATGFLTPYKVTFLNRPYGGMAMSLVFDDWYSLGLLILELAFIAYPCRLMILRSRVTHSPVTASALKFIPLSWAGVGVTLLVFGGFLRYFGFEIVEVGNLISASLFLFTVYFFRKTTLLESFFEAPIEVESPFKGYARRFSERLGVGYPQLAGKKMLLEFDPSSSYEAFVKDFVQENLRRSELVVITRRGSPVHIALVDQPQIRFLCLTHGVSYPKEGSSDKEILIPPDDPSIILGALKKAFEADPDAQLSMVIDNISDLIITLGIEKTYSFLGYSLELISDPKVTALYLLNTSAHDSKTVSAVRALFSIQIARTEAGIKIVKALQS